MHRIGLPTHETELQSTVDAVKRFAAHSKELEQLNFVALCTHLSEAAVGCDFSLEQAYRFGEVFRAVARAGVSVPCIHIENSVSAMENLLPQRFLAELVEECGSEPCRSYVRVGMAAYGYYGGPQEQVLLKPVLSLKAQVRHVQLARKGDPVSYDRTYRCEADTLIATLGCGYADGYPRCLSNVGRALLRGQTYPTIGSVCMDMLMVNLGSPDGPGKNIRVGEYATLALTYGTGDPNDEDSVGRLDWDSLSELAGTVSTEVMTGINKRVARVYVE